MIKIMKDHTDFNCDVCNVRGNNIYNIILRNERFRELHLCKDCCKDLRNLLKLTQHDGVKMVSTDNIDK